MPEATFRCEGCGTELLTSGTYCWKCGRRTPDVIPDSAIIPPAKPRQVLATTPARVVGLILFTLGLLALFGADAMNDMHVVNIQILTIGETFTIAGAVFLAR